MDVSVSILNVSIAVCFLFSGPGIKDVMWPAIKMEGRQEKGKRFY